MSKATVERPLTPVQKSLKAKHLEPSSVLTIKEAAKRHGLQMTTVDEAIRKGKLSALRVPAKRWWDEHLISATDLDRWIDGLSDRERLLVFPCTRKGCAAQEDHWPHIEETITPEGKPIHGMFLEDNRPKVESGQLRICKTGQPDPDSWEVSICAIGDEPWEVEAQVWAKDEFPLRQRPYVRAFYTIPDSPGLLAALNRAQEHADKLNAPR